MLLIWLILRTLFSGIIILYLQALVMPGLAVKGIIPNLFLGWLVFQVWFKPRQVVIPLAFILGLCFDLTTPDMLGLQALLFVLLAIGIGEFHKPLDKDSFISILITLGLENIVYAVAVFLVYGVQSGFGIALLGSFLVMLFYNLVVSVIVCAIYVFVSRLKLDFRNG
jgi:rod shape-determining protein MreD